MAKAYLGIDWGEKRIGLARGDSETKIATPYQTVASLNELLQIIKKEEIDVIVVGKPFKMSGVNFKLAEEYLNFIKNLKKATLLPLLEVDERLSSKAADKLRGIQKIKASRDEIAAMLILQQHLDSL